MQTKRTIRIVLSSPSDIDEECRVMDGVIAELNRGVAHERHVVLELIYWKTDVFPGFHPEGPQGVIDPILKIEDCDILLAIFWKRFGTPAQGAASGVEHEIRTAIKARQDTGPPQIMIYFKEAARELKTPAAGLLKPLIAKEEGNQSKLVLIDGLEQTLHLIAAAKQQKLVQETLDILLIKCQEHDCEVIYHAQELLEKLGMQPLQPGGLIYELFDLEHAAERQQEFLADPANHFE